jgi:hypothetical protein
MTPARTTASRRAVVAAAALALAGTALAAGNDAKGTIAYKNFNVALKYAWLVKGPDSMDPKKTIRKLVLSATDIGAKLAACASMSCADGSVTEGATVDFDSGPRLNYWMVVNGQKVQYSGTVVPSALAAKANDANHVAGRLTIDDAAMGGPKIDAEFDATVGKEYKAAR